jgi:hypothetical protein
MIKEFDTLTNHEIELMLKTPLMVCILVAGADGHIDRKEIKGAIELAKKKQKRARAQLLEYFQIMGEDFEDKLKIVMQGYPMDVEKRTIRLIEELGELNSILPKLDREFAGAFYESVKGIARVIAESSGGLLGIKKVGEEEARYVELPMIKNPN